MAFSLRKIDDVQRTRELLAGFKKRQQSQVVEEIQKSDLATLQDEPTLFEYAGLSDTEKRKFIGLVLVASVFVFAVTAVIPVLFVKAFALLPALIGYVAISLKARKRASSFEQDFPAFLLTVSGGVKVGLDPLSALLKAKELFEENSELVKELTKFEKALDGGATTEKAIQEFGRTIDHPDISLFRTAFILSKREGSSLASCLSRLTKVTRSRQSFRRKVKAAVAMQKLSSYGIAVVAVLMLSYQFVGNHKAAIAAFQSPVGFPLIVFGGVAIVLGLFLIQKMAKPLV